jgi:predicted  nucleic acid-binding Zn-ribbon protein
LTATITSDFEEMILTWLTVAEKATLDAERGNYTKLQTEFEEYKKNYSTPEKDVVELRSYKNQKVADERQASVDAIFAKSEFETLKNNKEFNDFKANVGDMSLEDIETKCFAIYGKAQVQGKANFSVKKSVEKVPVVVKVDQTPSVDSAPYGGLFEEYKEK